MVKMKCYGCGYEWDYHGEKSFDDDYMSCPRCRKNLKYGKALEKPKEVKK